MIRFEILCADGPAQGTHESTTIGRIITVHNHRYERPRILSGGTPTYFHRP